MVSDVVSYDPLDSVVGTTTLYVTNTSIGRVRFRVRRDIFPPDHPPDDIFCLGDWPREASTVTTNEVFLSEDQFDALLRIEDVLREAPAEILPILADEFREVVEHETMVYLTRQRSEGPDPALLVEGVFAGQ